jgi:type IV pilus assembly protein PilX
VRPLLPFRNQSPALGQRGMALITGLLLLLVLTVLAVSMFRSFGSEEQIAGNTREKQRALNSAVSAQQYAEWWLINGTVPPDSTCAAIVSSDTGQICSNPLADFSTVPWSTGVTYTPFAQTQTVTGTTGQASQGSYYAAPVYYITDLGTATDSAGDSGELYQIDAYGYGGTSNAVAEVESTYLVSSQYGQRQLDISK